MTEMRKKAKELAEALLHAIDFQNPPVSLGQILTWLEENTGLKFHLRYSPELLKHHGLSGQMLRNGNQVWILLNAHDSPQRQRFTFGHEVGHFLAALESAGMPSLVASHATEERYADVFSSEINMPEEVVRREWDRLKESYTQPIVQFRLAEIFGVSKEAMGYRLDELGLLTGRWNEETVPPVYTN